MITTALGLLILVCVFLISNARSRVRCLEKDLAELRKRIYIAEMAAFGPITGPGSEVAELGRLTMIAQAKRERDGER